MRIMATLDEPNGGDVYLNGISVVENPEEARGLIGFVPDSLPTHRDISVHEYLDFFGRAYGVPAKRRRKVVESTEEFTNLMGIRDKALNVLSKGMKQRVSLARALLHDPPILIMDEPAAGLDPRARIELRELVKILASQGKSILISSHILSELAEMIDGLIIIEHGRKLQSGLLSDIKSSIQGCIVLIRTLDVETDTICRDLLEMPHVEDVSVDGSYVRLALSGQEDCSAEILKLLVNKGHSIIEFRHESNSLEEVFMNITRGDVR